MDWVKALSPLVGTLGGVVGTLLAGPAGGAAGAVIGKAIAEVAGIDPTPEAIASAPRDIVEQAAATVAADPVVIDRAKTEAMQELELRLRDTQDARAQTIKLAEQGSAISWGAPIISTLVTLGFLAVVFIFISRPIPLTDTQAAVLNILLGALTTAFIQVVNYWLGSSFGSTKKDSVLSTIATSAGRVAEAVKGVRK